jgi:hypothetical protein
VRRISHTGYVPCAVHSFLSMRQVDVACYTCSGSRDRCALQTRKARRAPLAAALLCTESTCEVDLQTTHRHTYTPGPGNRRWNGPPEFSTGRACTTHCGGGVPTQLDPSGPSLKLGLVISISYFVFLTRRHTTHVSCVVQHWHPLRRGCCPRVLLPTSCIVIIT